jgi:hypothetical protein
VTVTTGLRDGPAEVGTLSLAAWSSEEEVSLFSPSPYIIQYGLMQCDTSLDVQVCNARVASTAMPDHLPNAFPPPRKPPTVKCVSAPQRCEHTCY